MRSKPDTKMSVLDKKMQKPCRDCSGKLVIEEASFICSQCGLVQGQDLNTNNVSYGWSTDPASQYTRTYRFRTLLVELSGTTRFPDPLAKFMLEKRNEIVSIGVLKRLLNLAGLKRYQSKCTAILMWANRCQRPITDAQIDMACHRFRQLDRAIHIETGNKPAFTYLLPTVLHYTPGCQLLAASQLIKKPSLFLIKKYKASVDAGLKRLGWISSEAVG